MVSKGVTTEFLHWFWIAAAGIAIFPSSAPGQIVPDNTLGSEGSVVTPNASVRGGFADLIEGGAVRDANLFHSFREFNVGNLQRVYFANPSSIANILSRVTGTNRSDILGTLGVDGSANLFLINPNGILFGPNASLDISGSFTASTANSFVFSNSEAFSATNPNAPPLLAVNLSPGLQYGANSGDIASSGNLSVGGNLIFGATNLTLSGRLQSGGNMRLRALDTLTIRDSTATPFIAAATENLLIQGDQLVDIFALNHANSGLFSGSDMVLRSANDVLGDAHYHTGGSFRIEPLNGSGGGLFSPNDPVITSLGDVSFTSYTGQSLHIIAGGSVNVTGNIRITGVDAANGLSENITLSDGRTLAINGATVPTLDIRAGVSPGIVATFTPAPAGGFFVGGPTTTPTPTSANITIGSITNNQSTGLVITPFTPPPGRVFLSNQYQPNSSLSGDITVGAISGNRPGNGSSVFIDSRGAIAVNGDIDTSSGLAFLPPSLFIGQGGDITLLAKDNITVAPGANIRAESFTGQGLGGTIELHTQGDIFLTGTGFPDRNISNLSGAMAPAGATAGNISLKARSFFATNGFEINSTTLGPANAGNISIIASDTVSFDNLSSAISRVDIGASGNGGVINIETGSFTLSNSSGLDSRTLGSGTGGGISIRASDSVSLNNAAFINAIVEATSTGTQGGDIELNARTIEISDNARIINNTFGQGNSGRILLNATDTLSIGDSVEVLTTVESGAVGNGGLIDLRGQSVFINSGARVSASTSGQGNAGSVFAQGTNLLSISGGSELSTAVNAGAVGQGGAIEFQVKNLFVNGGGKVSASTSGTGNSGNILARNATQISLDNGSISTAVNAGAVGQGGLIDFQTANLFLNNGSQVSAATSGQGNAGLINVRDADLVALDNSSISTAVNAGAIGNGGSVEVQTGKLTLTNGAQISASTAGLGNGGQVTARASGDLEASGGSQILTTTFGSGNAGDIKLDVSGDIILTGAGTGVFANTAPGSTGNGGSVDIDPQLVLIQQGAGVGVGSLGSGVGGDVKLQSGTLILNDRAFISAETASTQGGNITLDINDILLMRRNSSISTTAGTANAGGDGGNIDIFAKFIVAVPGENSDITANAFEGRGGNITIRTQGLYGIQFRSMLTPLSDITASSQFGIDGVVEINTPEVDPSRGLSELPGNLIDPEDLLAESCLAAGESIASDDNEFVITGRQGLPASPNDLQRDEAVLSDWIEVPEEAPQSRPSSADPTTDRSDAKPIVEAHALAVGKDGKVFLTASTNPVPAPENWQVSPSCRHDP